jgi:hypothetical protein
MNSMQDSLIPPIDWIPALVFIGLSEMVRTILTYDIEKRLGRKLTDWEWQYFLQESNRKFEADSRQEVTRQLQQQVIDRKTIYDFVWKVM